MSNSRPRFVYHYTSTNTALEHILPNMRLRFGSLAKTNDPRETTALSMLSGLRRKNVRLSRMTDDLNYVTLKANEVRLKEWWCLCCSVDDAGDIPAQGYRDQLHGYERAQLWAHYASNHAGVCLELDADRLHEAIQVAVDDRGSVFEGLVSYNAPTAEYAGKKAGRARTIPWRGTRDEMLQRIRAHLQKHHDWHFLSKGIDWEPEREYRWLVNAAGRLRLVDISQSLCSVIVGMGFSPSNERALHRHCGEYGVRVDRMRWTNRIPIRDIGGAEEGWGRRDRLKGVPVPQIEVILYDGTDPLM